MSRMLLAGCCRWWLALLSMAVSLPGWGACNMPLTAYYSERPPYLMARPDGGPDGLTGTQARTAFAQAGIPVKWLMLPTNRQLAMIEANEECVCAIGWFRNTQRESFARFSQPIYRDKPWVAIVHQSTGVSGRTTVEHLLHMNVPVLVKEQFSYGPYLDGKLAAYDGLLVRSSVEVQQQLQLVLHQRAKVTFMTEEEGRFLLSQLHPGERTQLNLLTLSDVPQGEFRHVICSKQVDTVLLERLDKAITALGK